MPVPGFTRLCLGTKQRGDRTKLAKSMETKVNSSVTGKTAQPAETTVDKDKKSKGPVLTSDAVASLLQSEWANDAETPEQTQVTEVQPEPNAGVTNDLTAEKADQTAGDETPQAEPAEDAEPAVEAEDSGTEEMPAELQSAIEQWESKGGGELPAVLQKLVDRRISREVGKTKAEKERAEALAAEAEQLRGEVEQLRNDPQRQGPPPTVADERALSNTQKAARTFVNDVENFLDGSATDEERTRVERHMQANGLDESKLKRLMRDTKNWLTDEYPQELQKVRTFKQQETALEPVVKKFFPRLDDKAAPEYQIAQQVLRDYPEVRSRTPAHRAAVGIYVLGKTVFDHLQAADTPDMVSKVKELLSAVKLPGTLGTTTAPATVKKAPPKPPTGAAAPVRTPGQPKREEVARESFHKAPTRENVTELLKAGLRS